MMESPWACSEFKKRQKAVQVAKQREEKKVHFPTCLLFRGDLAFFWVWVC